MGRIPTILCMTSDNYIEAVRPFLWLLRKYWRDGGSVLDVAVAGYTPPSFDLNDSNGGSVRAKFISIGSQEDFPLEKWSDSLVIALDKLGEELVIIMLEDYWVIRQINAPAIALATEYMHQYPSTLKFDLAADRLFAWGATKDFRRAGWLDIVKSNIDSPYHMSLMTGIWRTAILKEVIKPGWNPWEIELEGTNHLKNYPQYDVVGCAQWPIKHTLAFRNGDSSKVLLNELENEDVNAMRRLGFFAKWGA